MVLYAYAPVIVSLGLFMLFLFYHFETFNPGVVYSGVGMPYGEGQVNSSLSGFTSAQGPRFSLDAGQMLLTEIYRFFSQQQGLLFYAPFYSFFIIGTLVLVRHRKHYDLNIVALLAALTMPYLLIYMTTEAYGGYCPPTRTLVPLLPLILWLTANGLKYLLDNKQVLLLVPAIAASLAIAAFMLLKPSIIYDHNLPDVISPSFASLASLFPDQSPGAVITILFWALVALLLMAINELALSLITQKRNP
jgi:hypothetical protein